VADLVAVVAAVAAAAIAVAAAAAAGATKPKNSSPLHIVGGDGLVFLIRLWTAFCRSGGRFVQNAGFPVSSRNRFLKANSIPTLHTSVAMAQFLFTVNSPTTWSIIIPHKSLSH
jgi:hypothetical protein